MKRKSHLILKLFAYIALSVLSVVMLFPYVWMIFNSFRATEDIVLKPLELFSGSYTTDAYKGILMVGTHPIWFYFKNSLIITISSVLLTIVVCSLGAYAMTRRSRSRGFRAVLFLFMVSIMYPWALLVIPLYVIVLNLGLIGTHLGIILAITGGTGISLPVFIFQQFFKSIPYEVIESADIEGAKELKILLKIVFPMAGPVFGTVALLTFMTNWGEWFYVSVLSNKTATATMPVGLMNLNTELFLEMNRIMAMASIISVPIIILFIFTQKRVTEGIAVGSVKG